MKEKEIWKKSITEDTKKIEGNERRKGKKIAKERNLEKYGQERNWKGGQKRKEENKVWNGWNLIF